VSGERLNFSRAKAAALRCNTYVLHSSCMYTDTNMPKDAYINARVDKQLKAKAEKVLQRIGVSTTDAITMLLHQIVLRNGVPFDVCIPNKETRRAMAELDGGKGESFEEATDEVFDRSGGSRE
jgi:DNA-damage-inducible protein J